MDPEFKEKLNKVINNLDDGLGARYFDVQKKADEMRWNMTIVNDLIGEMIDDGEMYEPVIGKLKLI